MRGIHEFVPPFSYEKKAFSRGGQGFSHEHSPGPALSKRVRRQAAAGRGGRARAGGAARGRVPCAAAPGPAGRCARAALLTSAPPVLAPVCAAGLEECRLRWRSQRTLARPARPPPPSSATWAPPRRSSLPVRAPPAPPAPPSRAPGVTAAPLTSRGRFRCRREPAPRTCRPKAPGAPLSGRARALGRSSWGLCLCCMQPCRPSAGVDVVWYLRRPRRAGWTLQPRRGGAAAMGCNSGWGQSYPLRLHVRGCISPHVYVMSSRFVGELRTDLVTFARWADVRVLCCVCVRVLQTWVLPTARPSRAWASARWA